MNFSLHENLDFNGAENRIEFTSAPEIHFEDIHIFAEKLQIPECEDFLERPRLIKLLEKNSEHFGATFITGRAGTGKTALVSDFAKRYEQVAWYSIGASDCDWKVFSAYLHAGFNESRLNLKKNENCNATKTEIAWFVESLFSRLSIIGKKKPLLIVLDDIHHIFDCDWFNNFFNTLIYSLTPDTHLLMLSRSEPPLPLWRLRSKQVLGVIDEKLLALTCEETKDLYHKHGLSKDKAQRFYKKSFGRIPKLKFEK
ncbi:MAG: hypothetical protein LC778_20780 [Acidobacteria bacterium]|nr:hypothetical protein [Acidobacteriota bacterium]